MKNILAKLGAHPLRSALTAAALSVAVLGAATPASARDWHVAPVGWHGGGWGYHGGYYGHGYWRGGAWYPGIYVAPPVVYPNPYYYPPAPPPYGQ